MARANVNQVINIGFETTPGTAAVPNRRLTATMLLLNPNSEAVPFQASGYKVDTLLSQGKEWTDGTLDMIGNFEEIQYLCDSAFGAVAPSLPAGGLGIAQQRVWAPKSNSDTVSPRTFTIDKGDYAATPRAARVLYAQMKDFEVNFDRKMIGFKSTFLARAVDTTVTMGALGTNAVYLLSATGLVTGGNFTLTYGGQTTAVIAAASTAQQIQDALNKLTSVGGNNFSVQMNQATFITGAIATIYAQNNFAGIVTTAMTITPAGLTGGGSASVTNPTAGVAGVSELIVHQMLAKNITVFADDTYANLGVSALTACYAGNVKIMSRFIETWPVNAGNASFGSTVETPNKATSQLSLEADAVGESFFINLRAGTRKYVRIRCTGRLLESGFTEKIDIDFPAFIVSPTQYADLNSVYTLPWDFSVSHDPLFGGTGGFVRITLWNDLTGN